MDKSTRQRAKDYAAILGGSIKALNYSDPEKAKLEQEAVGISDLFLYLGEPDLADLYLLAALEEI